MISTLRPRTTVAILAAAVVLTGCGDDPGAHEGHSTSIEGTVSAGPASPAPAEEHNAADIRFAQEMIPHHRQAVEMAALAPSRAADPAVIDLAARIEQAQDPEIATMTGWLQSWGAPVPEESGHAHHGDMPGMMTEEQMGGLEAARGPEFDRMWLTMMVAHHEGAVQMARTELAEGTDPAARALAQQIIDSQQAEIQQMNTLLRG